MLRAGQAGDGDLFLQVFRQGQFSRMGLARIAVFAFEAAAAAGLGPVDAAARVDAANGGAGVAGGVVAGRSAVVQIVVPHIQVRLGGAIGHMVGVVGVGVGLDRLGVRLAVGFVALQQRVALQLAIHERLKLKVRQLQKLDSLLQLRRDDEALPLP